jgi:hypothetical protein
VYDIAADLEAGFQGPFIVLLYAGVNVVGSNMMLYISIITPAFT